MSEHYETNRETVERTEQLDLSIVTEPPVPAPLARALEAELRKNVAGEVRFDDGYRALYATDGSNYRMPPVGVVVPATEDDVVAAIAVCHKFGVPILPRGGGTSLSGETCNAAVVIDLSKHLRDILELRPVDRMARVQPGCVLDDLRRSAKKHHLTFAPDPSTHRYCTIGGMLGNNSCGVHSVMAGRTSDNVDALELVTYDGLRMTVGATSDEQLERYIRAGGRKGEIYARLKSIRDRYGELIRQRFPNIPRLVSGFGLDQLLPENGFNVARALVGTEGTCVTVLEATLRLVPWPSMRTLLLLGYPDIYRAADDVPSLMEHRPIGLEAIDGVLAEDMRKMHIHDEYLSMFPEGSAWLLLEFGGETKQEADAYALECEAAAKARARGFAIHAKMYDSDQIEKKAWLAREAGLGATARVKGQHDAWPGWEDSAVHPAKLGGYLRGMRKLYDKYEYHAALYGHFGQGCVHTRIDFELETPFGAERYHRFMEEATDLCVSMGGSLSGEHGDGQARAEFLEKMYGAELMQAFREFKATWDPGDKMNPGKVVTASGKPAYKTTENLRVGPTYEPRQPQTYFKYPNDEGDFARATTRCVGVGKCRVEKPEEGRVMCPSYQVTLEEEHSTRGRAHALFEMLHGGIDDQGWKSEGVKEALDLCLACKGCKTDCPMNVDMATYKAEFLAHYYEGKLRPRPAYAMGLIMYWARLAELAPRLANFFTQTPGVSALFKRAGGVAGQRQIPPFAQKTFRQLFRERVPARTEGPRVIIWPDTFNDHFHPQVAMAAVDVLEAAGYVVELPKARLCCGRPLYDYGMLPTAQRLLQRILDELDEEIDHGVPIVGLEPSCMAVFRDELVQLFPNDQRARRLSEQSFVLSEFLTRFAPDLELPELKQKAVVQKHCHHHAALEFDEEQKVFKKLGLEAKVLDSGCCGMAGSFGYEKEKYEIAQACGEQVCLPEVRKAGYDTLVLADGFSCRTMIEQGTGRQVLHLAEVLQRALQERGKLPVPRMREEPQRRAVPRPLTAALVAGGVAVAALGAISLRAKLAR